MKGMLDLEFRIHHVSLWGESHDQSCEILWAATEPSLSKADRQTGIHPLTRYIPDVPLVGLKQHFLDFEYKCQLGLSFLKLYWSMQYLLTVECVIVKAVKIDS